jgi:CyaY protein
MDEAATLKFAFHMQRILAAMSVELTPTSLTDTEFHALANSVLSSVEATVDRWLQDDVVDIDSHRTGGLLELSFPNGSKLVLNTQPPLHELWLAARSGGYHYKHVNGQWLDTREGREFFDALSACASEQSGLALRFVPPA